MAVLVERRMVERILGLGHKLSKVAMLAFLLPIALFASPAIAETSSGKAAALLKSLRSADALTQPSIVRALEQLGADAVPSLIAVTKAGDKVSRHRSIEILGRLGDVAKPAIPDLVAALADPETQIRRNAAWALGRIGPAAGDALPDLLGAFDDIEWYVRSDAVWAAGKILIGEAQADDEVMPALIAALKDESHHVRWSAIWALARIGPSAEASVPDLVDLLQDPVAKIRASAASSLARVALPYHGATIVPALTAATADHASIVRSRAAAALRKFQRRTAPGM